MSGLRVKTEGQEVRFPVNADNWEGWAIDWRDASDLCNRLEVKVQEAKKAFEQLEVDLCRAKEVRDSFQKILQIAALGNSAGNLLQEFVHQNFIKNEIHF